MDLNTNRKLLKGKRNSSIGEAEDRVSELPDAILHHILSFLEFKLVVRTCVLSKRWNYIWTSMPILQFPSWESEICLSEINKFMYFVDRTLLLRHPSSNIQKANIETLVDMNASRVHSWISYITKRNVQELSVCLRLNEPFFIPYSLFTCDSLTKLELSVSCDIHIPKSFCFPKLKSLQLYCIKFTDDNGWKFSNCPVLEYLTLESCTWFGMRKLCILTPSLKVLEFRNYSSTEDGVQDCDLKIYAPDLVSLAYFDSVARDYDLSSFVKLDHAEIYFNEYDGEERIGNVAAASKFLQAISHVKSLMIDTLDLEALHIANHFVNIMPTFHNLNKLDMTIGPVKDDLIFAFLKAAPNLKQLEFYWDYFSPDDYNIVYDKPEDLFRYLQSVWFKGFSGEAREWQWVKLILMHAKSLQRMTLSGTTAYSKSKEKEVVISELENLPTASEGCMFKFV